MKKKIITRTVFSLILGLIFLLLSRYIVDLRGFASVAFTVSSVFFPILISTILSFDLGPIQNPKVEKRIRNRLNEHKISSLFQYGLVSFFFITSAFIGSNFAGKTILCLTIGSSIMSISYDIGVGIFGLPKLKNDLMKAIRSETLDINHTLEGVG